MKLLQSIRIKRLATTFAFVFAIIVAQFGNVQFASAATLTWDGSSNGNLNTAANWAGNAVPVSGDVVTFPAGIATTTLTNDLVGVNLGGISIAGGSSGTTTAYTIDVLSFATGATVDSTGTDTTLSVSGAVTSAGTLSVTGAGAAVTFGSTVNTVGNLTVSGTNLIFTGAVTVGGIGSFTGTSNSNNTYLTLSGALNVTGNLSLLGSNYTGSGAVVVGGNLVVKTSLYSNRIYTVTGTTTIGDSVAYSYGSIQPAGSSTFTGVVTVDQGSFSQPAGASITVGSLIVKNDGSATLDGTAAFPITFGSGLSTANPSLVYNNTVTYGPPAVYGDLKLTGAITLLNNLEVSVAGNATSGSVEISGAITKNGFSITKATGSSGKLIVGGAEVKNASATNEYNGDQPTAYINIVENETAILNGTRGSITVFTGGLLKGTGTVASNLFVAYGGVVNPGNSPGKLTVLQSLTLAGGSTYQAELLNKDTYDQLQVGAEYSGGGNAVTLGSSTDDLPTLQTTLYDGWSVTQGDTFTIIDNKSSTAVVRTFAGLPEGTQFAVDGVTFSISYIGGDGNDVVLTALNAGNDPTPPNTGAMHIAMANPIVLAGLGVVSAGILIAAVARRRNTN